MIRVVWSVDTMVCIYLGISDGYRLHYGGLRGPMDIQSKKQDLLQVTFSRVLADGNCSL